MTEKILSKLSDEEVLWLMKSDKEVLRKLLEQEFLTRVLSHDLEIVRPTESVGPVLVGTTSLPAEIEIGNKQTLSQLAEELDRPRRHNNITPEGRKAIADAQKKRWAKRYEKK